MSELCLSADDIRPDVSPVAAPWGWRDLGRAILLALLGFAGLFVLLVIAMVVRQLSGSHDDPVVLGTGIEVGLYGIIVLAVYWCTVRRYRVGWDMLGLRGVSWWWLALAPLCTAGMLAITLAIHALISVIQGQPFNNPQVEALTQGQQLTPTHLAVLLLGVAVAAPIGEELLFRGMLYPILRRRTPAWLAVALNAAIFAALHFIPILFPALFVAGVVLAAVRARTSSVLPGMLIHGLQNAVFVLGVYAAFSGA